MPRYHVKGRVQLTVLQLEDEVERIDEIIEADTEHLAYDVAIQCAKDEYPEALEIKVMSDNLTFTIVEESPEDRTERLATEAARQNHRLMLKIGATTLPGSEGH